MEPFQRYPNFWRTGLAPPSRLLDVCLALTEERLFLDVGRFQFQKSPFLSFCHFQINQPSRGIDLERGEEAYGDCRTNHQD